MVRGPAAVLTAYGGALLYFELAPSLPSLGDGDVATIVGGGAGMAAVAVAVLALVPTRDESVVMVLLLAGAGLLAGALQVAVAGPAAEVAKLLFAAAAGMLLARALDTPPVIVAVPVLVAAIDVAGALGGPASLVVHPQTQMTSFATLALPRWSASGTTQLALSDVLFLGFYASGAWRYGFRRRATAVGLYLGLVGPLVAGVVVGRQLPVLPGLALGLLAPNLDRLEPLLTSPDRG